MTVIPAAPDDDLLDQIPPTPQADVEPIIDIEPNRIPDTSFNIGDEQPIQRPPHIPDEKVLFKSINHYINKYKKIY